VSTEISVIFQYFIILAATVTLNIKTDNYVSISVGSMIPRYISACRNESWRLDLMSRQVFISLWQPRSWIG